MKIIAATSNAGKLREIKSIFSDKDINIISQKEAGIKNDAEETGETFEENAYIKAKAVWDKAKDTAVIADDSGLCVKALGGAPGIYSARYAGENATDEERIEKLLREMKDKEDRRAEFISAVSFITPAGECITARGTVSGRITKEVSGSGGFGYDPVFFADEIGKTFADASAEEKNKISHRARALFELYKKLTERGIV